MNITVLGAGYVGLVTGATFAHFGHEICILDIDDSRIDLLRRGHCPIYEPGLTELLHSGKSHIAYTSGYNDALENSDAVFVAVGTPQHPDGSPDLSYVQEAAHQIGLRMKDRYLVIVNKSTVPIGSGDWVASIFLDGYESSHDGRAEGRFAVASNPEFLKEGTALQDTFYPDRIVLGSRDHRAIAVLSELYRPLLNQDFVSPAFLPRPEGFGAVPLVTTDLASAEMIKYAANAFLTVKISFINEIGYGGPHCQDHFPAACV